MNRPDDFDGLDRFSQHLQSRLNGLVADEPPMESMPSNDLHRGRRLVRRRRWGAAGTAAVLVPAMAFGAVAVSNNLFTGSGPGAQLVPEQGGDATTADDSSTLCSSGTVSASLPEGAEPNVSLPPTPATIGADDPDGPVTCVTGDASPIAECAPDDKECENYVSDPIQDERLDRLDHVLGDQLDPGGTYTGDIGISAASSGSMSVGRGGANSDAGTESVMVGRSWVDGNQEGAISLSASSQPDRDFLDGCMDATMGSGPRPTCEQKTLADGTVVQVGHATLDGAERLTVLYERPDGSVVVVAADEASSQWWDDGSGRAPLEAPPATVDQLIDLVTAPAAHF